MSVQIKRRWEPHSGQQPIVASDARYRIVACGRRFGKTTLAAHEAFEALATTPGGFAWWVGPQHRHAEIGFRMLKEIIPDGFIEGKPKETSPYRIHLINGAWIEFQSADSSNGLVGEGVDFLVIDEAAMVPDRAWNESLRPTLMDTGGSMLAISTPRPTGWFKSWFARGQDADYPEVDSWNRPTSANPHIPADEIEESRKSMPDRAFRQEVMAEFLDSDGSVFGDLTRITEAYDLAEARANGSGPFALGVDFARKDDWTVVHGLDGTGRTVVWDRLQDKPWPEIQRRIESLAGQLPGLAVAAVDASRDNKIVADLEDAGLPVLPVAFSPKTKTNLIEDLITAVEQGEVVIPEIPQLINELELFDFDVTRAGNVRYHAPEGHKDDSVDAFALAHRARREAAGRTAGRNQERGVRSF